MKSNRIRKDSSKEKPAKKPAKEVPSAPLSTIGQPTLGPKVKKMEGLWVSKVIDGNNVIYASFDTHQQFISIKGRTSGVSKTVRLETGEILTVKNCWPSKPENVRTFFPTRDMPLSWLNPKLYAEKQKQAKEQAKVAKEKKDVADQPSTVPPVSETEARTPQQ